MCAAFDGTYLPGEDPVPMAEVERFLEQEGESGFFLVGAAGRVPVPPELASVLREAVDFFRYNQAVVMTSLPLTVTPGQAAPILQAREDQVEEMLDAGTLPSVGTEHARRIPLRDLLAYRRRVLDDLHESLADTAFYDDDSDVVTDERQG